MKRMIPVDDFIGLIDKLRESAYFMHSDDTESRTIDWQDAEGILLIFREQNVIEFDDDGWCHDLDKMPKDAEVLVFDGISVFTALKDVYRVGRGYRTNYYASVDSEVPYCGVCEHSFREFTPKAWRPLPDFPEVKK